MSPTQCRYCGAQLPPGNLASRLCPDCDEADPADQTCPWCHGSGGGDEPALFCRYCRGTGVQRHVYHEEDENER